MAIGKGGQSGSQNQNQFGSYTGNGSTAQNSSGTSSTQVNAPDGWQAAWNGFQPGSQGFNPTQQTGVNWMTNQLGGIDPNRGATNINLASNYFQDTLANRTAPTLANLAASGNPAYATPADVQAQQIAARRGSEFINDYQNPFLKDVLDTSLQDYDVGTDRAANAFRVANIAGGASGAGSNPVGAAIFAGEANRGRGALSSGIRSNAFNTAANFGMADAGRFLAADQSNQQAKLAADTFNNQQAQSRNMFDANLGMQYNAQRDGVASTLANLGNSDYALGQGLAGGLVNAGGMGQNQNLNWLNAGVPLFGQTNTTNQTSTGTSSESGSTSGNSSGNSRGKSGGISLN